jgi:hypothetical protein
MLTRLLQLFDMASEKPDQPQNVKHQGVVNKPWYGGRGCVKRHVSPYTVACGPTQAEAKYAAMTQTEHKLP